jgi:hypothetical protein
MSRIVNLTIGNGSFMVRGVLVSTGIGSGWGYDGGESAIGMLTIIDGIFSSIAGGVFAAGIGSGGAVSLSEHAPFHRSESTVSVI